MASIDELMEGKAPGSVKISGNSWPIPSQYFQPYFKNVNGDWFGLTEKAEHASYSNSYFCWQLWSTPEETVEVFEWMLKRGNGSWSIIGMLVTEEEMKASYKEAGYIYKKTGRSFKVPK